MKKTAIWTLALVGTLGMGIGLFAPRQTRADEPAPLPACATDGDKDGDGIADEVDNDETDSCKASSTGRENCDTGAGDGLPDCQ